MSGYLWGGRLCPPVRKPARGHRGPRYTILALFAVASFAWALVPGDLHHRDPLIPALYHTESFENQDAPVPNTLQDAKTKLAALIQADSTNAAAHRALSEVNVQLMDFAAAEAHIKTYAEKTRDYAELEVYYHSRLDFDKEFTAMQQHAATLTVHESDVENQSGRYGLYKRMIDHIKTYQIAIDPKTVYLAAIDAYPSRQQPYLDYIGFLKATDPQAAIQTLESFKQKFPADTKTYLLTKASLLSEKEALDLMNRSFDPLWTEELYRGFDNYLVAENTKRDYLNSLKDRLQKNPLDTDAVMRLFHAYHLAGNLMEAQNTLNDYRLLKEQTVREKKGAWSAQELYWMASLNHKILNYNEAARFYYSLYALLSYKKDPELQADTALHGLFEVLLAAEERPVQLSAGNLDYYKDIAAMDQNPGILNGILSLILNGTNPQREWQYQEDKAHGYFNRSEAMRLVRFTQKNFPSSKFLAGMYRDSLRIYEKYGMDRLLVEAGESFFRTFPKSSEVLEVGIAVADAYARLKEYEKEWNTYRFLLPVAAERNQERTLIAVPNDQEEDFDRRPPQQQPQIDYEFLLNRYIASLTRQNEHMNVVRLYQEQIGQHPEEEALYERFAAYLIQNQMFEQEKKLYEQAISKFRGKGWYEKLARWYLRFQRDQEYEKLSQEMMDIFRGTEIETYLQQTSGSSQQLYFALNLYAHEKFPLNVTFVRNLLSYYEGTRRYQEWEALAAKHYFLDESIRQSYLQYLSARQRLPQSVETSNAAYTRFAGDIAAWKSHFEEATTYYDQLAKSYPADPGINIRLADLKRSLGVQDVQNYYAAARIRERLAAITPSDSTHWTTAGETLADIEQYGDSKKYWEQILRIDPYNPDRYVEVATIYWDYYLFDDALSTIATIRDKKKDPLLFAYEAGAIYESKREYSAAIAEYAKSLTDGSEMAWQRLGELYKRKKFTTSIQQQLDAQLQKEPQNEKLWAGVLRFYAEQKENDLLRSIQNRAMTTLKQDAFHNIADTLKQQTRDLGFTEQHEKILQRQIADAASDVERWNRMLELARFHEANKQANRAEEVYRRLYRDQPKSAGIIQEIVTYYWRTEQFEKAFGIYREALAAANANWRKTYLYQIAGRYRERKDFANALLHARDLLHIDPLNMQNFQLVAELLAEQKDYASLAAHYKEGLKRVQEAKLEPEEKKRRTADLRRGIVQANVILKDYTAALDQYIEIINRDAESEEGLKQAADFAAKYGLNQRLFDYYTRTGAASPQDHRWPMVLGRLHLYNGDFQTAIQHFQTAIEIRPERSDFYQQVAESFQRLGQYEEAIGAYEKAYEISFKNKRWLVPMAELHARLGHKEKALDLYAQTLTESSSMQRNFLMAQKALAWGWPDKAATYGKTALDLYFKDMSAPFPNEGFQAYLEAQIRSGKRLDSFASLRLVSSRIEAALPRAQFESETLRSAQYMVGDAFASRYPELLRKYFLEEDWKQIESALFQDIAQKGGYRGMYQQIIRLYLPMVRSARMAPAEERLLRELALYHKSRAPKQEGEEWSRYMQYRGELLSFYERRQAYGQAARWLDQEYRTYRNRQLLREDLVRIAELYRLAEMPDEELSALRTYYAFGAELDLRPEPVKRYLDLLYQRNAVTELKQAAAKGNLISANYFFARKDKDLSIAAIQSLHARYKNDPSWQSIQLAMIGWQIPEANEFFDSSFHSALDLRTIGNLLAEPPDITRTLEGDAWFYYARLHGEYLYATGRKDQAAYALNSDLEGLSTASLRQNQLGNFYLSHSEYRKALDHFELALQLSDDNLDYVDDRARALVDLGRKQEAIDVWKSVIASEEHRGKIWAWEIVLQAAIDFDFLPAVHQEVAAFLEKQIRRTGYSASLLELYLNAMEEQQQMELVQKWIRIAPSPLEFGNALAGRGRSKPRLRSVELAIYSTVNEYLESRALTAAGQEQRVVRNDLWRWNQRYAKTLMANRSYDRADEILRSIQEKFENSDEPESAFRVALLRAEVLNAAGKTDEGWQLLQAFVAPSDPMQEEFREERYRKAIEALKQTALERRLKEEMYTWLLSTGRTEDAIYAGLAEVKLQNNQTDEAKALLRKMMYLNGENLEGFAAAAELFEKYKQWGEAILLRNEIAKRTPWDAANLARLAEDELQTGRKAEAAKLAAGVVTDPSSRAADRSIAAAVYANSSSGLAGPAEMIAIQKSIRANDSPAGGAYAHNLRTTLLKRNDQPSLKMLRAEFFLYPEEESLNIPLFSALVRENKCLQALETLDPQEERSGAYYPPTDQQSSGEEENYYYRDYHYPVERLNRSEEETTRIALQMAHCARELSDLSGEIFFRRMARAHTPDKQQQESLTAAIEKLEEELGNQQETEARAYRIALNAGRNP